MDMKNGFREINELVQGHSESGKAVHGLVKLQCSVQRAFHPPSGEGVRKASQIM